MRYEIVTADGELIGHADDESEAVRRARVEAEATGTDITVFGPDHFACVVNANGVCLTCEA